YIQTSQCNMQQLGEFDTVYHEHISFFTGHSFHKAATLAGLQIATFETTPIHGTSCLVTLQKGGNETISPTLQERLVQEKQDGVTNEFFAETYSAKALAIREWVLREISSFRSKGYIVGAYGAAAKGMTLLHFIFGSSAKAAGTPIAPGHPSRFDPHTAFQSWKLVAP
ncbi:novU, partial [Symbiodinium pilosum]